MAVQRWIKLTLMQVVAGLLMVASAGFSDTTTATVSPTAPKMVTLQVTNSPVIDAIDLLFQQAGYKYTIQPSVSGTITLGMKNVPFVDALKSLADGAGLTVKLSDGRYIISPKPKPAPAVAPKPVGPIAPAPGFEPGMDQYESVAPAPNSGPVFYGSVGNQPQMPMAYGLGAGTVYTLPNGESFYVIGNGYPRVLSGGSIIDGPEFNTPDWLRFKDELSRIQRPPKFY